jgi:sigma-B regulation protein RsbU (phosphoserine phosphatase)
MVLGPKLTKKEFSEDETHYLASIGNIAAPAIENAQVFKELNSVNKMLDQKIQELNTLFEIGNELNRIFEEDEILKRLSFSLMGQMMVNQFFICVKDENDTLKVVYKKGSRLSDEIIKKCLNTPLPKSKKAVILTEEEPEPYQILINAHIEVVVPMTTQDVIKGYIFLYKKPGNLPYTLSDCEFMTTLANLAIISIENARLFKETIEKQKLEEELNLAHGIQARLLPSYMPKLSRYDIHGFNVPSKHVGGDYYDIIRINENEYIFAIADVSGKGMPASLLMSNLQAGLHTLYSEKYSLSEITFRLNNLIFRNTTSEKYITFFISKINITENTLEFVNAGHNPPYLFKPDGTYDELSRGGIILGMMENMPYETGKLPFCENGILTMFTDGVTEAMSPGNIPYDEFRLIEFFKSRLNEKSSENINRKLIEELYEFAGDPTKDDDITLLTIRRLN